LNKARPVAQIVLPDWPVWQVSKLRSATSAGLGRMAKLNREHMADVDGEAPLGGAGMVVDFDEIYVGGKNWRKGKTVVMDMMERGGEVMLTVVDDQTHGSFMPQIMDNISIDNEIHTDELRIYNKAIPVDRYTRLCCTKPVRDSSRESSVIAGVHEQTHVPTYKTRNWPAYNEALKRRGSLTIWFDPR